jgi:ubiquinone/menaquinone biosynthesis C-methylase UbiE
MLSSPPTYEAQSLEASSALHTNLPLQCTRCGAQLFRLECPECTFIMRVDNGIVLTLPPERAQHFAQFIADYEGIRAAEGRGSESEEYYLGLPYKDTTGRNSRQWVIRSKSYDYLAKNILRQTGGRQSVLDLGAGNCWMSYRLALAGHRPVAVDLLTNNQDGLGAADHYCAYLSHPIPRFQAELTRLPFRDKQFDAVIFNASFHYSEDYKATLREALRCLQNNGCIIVSDTPWYSCEESGRQMVEERQAAFRQRFGTASDSVKSLEYLTDERLRELEKQLSIRWTVHSPWYGVKWAMRPWLAKIGRRREPSRFRIYVARKHD